MATGGLLLKEKSLGTPENHDWTQYQGQFVAVNCSTDAIVRVGFHISYNSALSLLR
jgi:hypothetical protein